MKRKRCKASLLALVIGLYGLQCGFQVSASELDFSGMKFSSGDVTIHTPPAPLHILSSDEAAEINEKMITYIPPETSLLKNKAETYYYYNQLNPIARQIYDVMYMIACDPKVDNYGVMMTDMDPTTDEFYYEKFCAEIALTYDHPELFWLYNGTEAAIGFLSEAMSINGIYMVYFGLMKEFEEYETQMNAFNSAVDAFLADINTNTSDYEIVKQVHDKLIDMVTYDDFTLEYMDSQSQNLAHTAYGALVENSQGLANYAVCDGYSLAFEYLLQQCGIEVVFMGGMAGANELSAGGHAWNMVNLDGKWYELDTTWDDAGSYDSQITPDINGYEYFREALSNSEYLEKIQHYMFLLSTDEIRNYVVDDNYYRYYSNDQQVSLCLVSDSVHIRFASDGTNSPYNAQPFVISLAPVAENDY